MPKKLSIFPIFLTVFIDMIGVGIVIPIFATVLIRPEAGLLSASTPESTRTILLGILSAVYPLAQFFGAPILGALSDRMGRKKVLAISLMGTVLGYLFFAYGLMIGNLWVLFFARFLDGFTGGNISIAMSAIADISDPKEKAKNFGLIGMAFGIGFILGPAIGGKLADPSLVSWFTFSTPFWFAAALSSVNVLIVLWMFQETLAQRIHSKISVTTGFKNIAKAFRMQNLRTMFIVMFLITLGFNFFTQFFQVYLIQKFSYTQSQIGDLFAYVGVWIVVVQGGLIRPLGKYFSSSTIFSFSALGLAISLPMLLVPSHSWMLFLVLPFVSVFNGLAGPNANAVISNLADARSQGEVLGINQSMQALAMVVPPIIAGVIVTIDRNLPILTAGLFVFLSWLVFAIFYQWKHRQTYHEK